MFDKIMEKVKLNYQLESLDESKDHNNSGLTLAFNLFLANFWSDITGGLDAPSVLYPSAIVVLLPNLFVSPIY
jgi:hypothetical protein